MEDRALVKERLKYHMSLINPVCTVSHIDQIMLNKTI